MWITTDDQLRQVDAHWLGVPGLTFPWRPTRYLAYAVGAPIAVLCAYIGITLFGASTWPILYSLAAAIVITSRLMRLVDDERPVKAIPVQVWAELGAPRRDPQAQGHELQITTDVPIWAFRGPEPGLDPIHLRSQHVLPEPQAPHSETSPADHPAAADRRSRGDDRAPWRRLVPARTRAVELSSRP